MNASFEIGSQYLAGNPILLTFNLSVGLTAGYRVLDVQTSELIYTARVTTVSGTQVVNINRLFHQNTMSDGVKQYTIQLFIGETTLQSATIEVYPGAISKRLQRELAKNSLTIFNTKLNPSDQNFLLSTRSFSRVIHIPEDELLPIPFYKKDKSFTVLGQSFGYGSTQGVDYLDFKTIRKNYYDSSQKLSQVFPVMSGGAASVTVVVTSAEKEHDYFIKFRNSLGALEMIAMDGDVDFTPEFEHQQIGIYDRLTGDTIEVPFSIGQKAKYKGLLRTLRPDETLLAMDMLLSREQYFVTPLGEFQVVVRSGEQTFQTTSGQPLILSVEIEAIDEERYYSPIDMERLSMIYENIFTNEFTIQYT